MSEPPNPPPSLNEVLLVGRVSAAPEERELPSGDVVTTLRLVLDRPPRRGDTRRQVDVIEVACWSARTRKAAASLEAGDVARVEGSLRRRFFPTAAGRASRHEVEAGRLTRVSRAAAVTRRAG